MRSGAIFLILLLALARGAGAQVSSDPATAAQAAAEHLSLAAEQLAKAEGAQNRVKALTETISAYEEGLEAIREGLRRIALREETLSTELAARDEETARFLAALMSIGTTPTPVTLVHPSGAVDMARAGMIFADVAPALDARAHSLRQGLEELAILQTLQRDAVERLKKGMVEVQQARTALSKAITERTNLPRRFTEDPVKTALLIASTETLEGFSSGLSEIAVEEVQGSLPDIGARKGTLPLPVEGRILRKAHEADAAGIARPGIVIATRPRAIVRTPVAATVRYRGSLLDYGNVIILEPQAGLLIVLAGLDIVYGAIGEVIPGGSPVGFMGGPEAESDLLVASQVKEQGETRTQTLYMEIRQDNSPVDPLMWFKTDKDK